jgi:hypothetical protein
MDLTELFKGVGIAIVIFIAILLIDDLIKKFKNKE